MVIYEKHSNVLQYKESKYRGFFPRLKFDIFSAMNWQPDDNGAFEVDWNVSIGNSSWTNSWELLSKWPNPNLLLNACVRVQKVQIVQHYQKSIRMKIVLMKNRKKGFLYTFKTNTAFFYSLRLLWGQNRVHGLALQYHPWRCTPLHDV